MFKQAKAGLLLSSAAYLILGVCLIGWPDLSVSLLCQGFGGVVLISGLVQVWRYLRREGNPFYAYLSLLYGVVAAAVGVALIAWPKLFLSVLPVVFGLFLIVDSIGRLGQALDLKAVGYGRWWVYLLTSLVSIALGAFVLCNPFQTVEAMVMAVGVILVLEAVMNLVGTLFASVTVWRLGRAMEKAEAEARALEEAAENAQAADKAEEFFRGEEGPVVDADAHPVEDEK